MKKYIHYSNSVATVILFAGLTTISPNIYANPETYKSDPRVFNWQFYLNANGDLLNAGISTEEAAREHWVSNGIYEGRQAHPAFHTRQYIDNYFDLNSAFGSNWLLALQHYINSGFSEGRIGYSAVYNNRRITEFNRLTISSSNATPYSDRIFLGASTRTAGGIDSIYWRDKEFINSYDHGRQLQVAVADSRYGECLNPTEAGNRSDAHGLDTTSSIIDGRLLGTNSLYTKNNPAYWLRPNETSAFCGGVGGARNSTITSTSEISKNTLIGVGGIPNVIGFNALIKYNESFPAGVQIEAPTGYLLSDFNNFYTYDPANSSSPLTTLSVSEHCDLNDPDVRDLVRALNGCKIATPVIASTLSGSHAMGIYNPHLHSTNPSTQKVGNYEFYYVDTKPNPVSGSGANSNKIASTSKWGTRLVEDGRNIYSGCTTEFNVYIAVGTKDIVHSAMLQLYAKQQSGQLPNPVSVGTRCP